MKRRQLLKTAALGALAGARPVLAQTAGTDGPKAPASDRIRVGMIGVGNFGNANLRQFLSHKDVEVAAICDVSQTAIDKAIESTGGKAKGYRDFRRVLDDKEIDAVVITTPEHWHSYMCIEACLAKKDVYVEKPIAHHISDGSLMVKTARAQNRVVQVGTQQRSGAHFQRAVKYIQDGRIGDVRYATCWTHFPPPAPRPPVTGGPPADLDWDMWLGPAPKLSYEDVLNGGRRNYWSLWGGQITEWGSHLTDIVLWAMKATHPEHVVAAGGLFYKKEGEIPDTLQVTWKYPAFLFHYSVLNHNTYGLNGDPGLARFGSYGMQFHGTKGTLFIDRGTFKVIPQMMRQEEADQMRPLPGSGTPDMRSPGFYYTTDTLPESSDPSLQHEPHVRNFLDCVKSRQRPNADIEVGHHANVANRLANIAYQLGRAMKWDAAREQVVADAEANKLVLGAYREPWKPKGL
jgi:predicted dehydrogenase